MTCVRILNPYHRSFVNVAVPALLLCWLLIGSSDLSFGQTESATLSGTIVDQTGAVVPGVRVTITNEDTNVATEGMTTGAGVYSIPGLKPGRYRMTVEKDGFKRVSVRDIVLNVQEVANRNFQLQVGGTSETVQVESGVPLVNTQDAAVSTVVDRQFAENLPLNGRSFQTLIALTPGVVLTAASISDPGQFSVNGQRATSNYFTVDGVSANIGISARATEALSQTAGGSIPGFTALGGTNSLVSVDAMQEFRVQTSTYSPEFGRTPGAQVSIVTRSGTNEFHGALFEYFRNDVFDANDWFSNQKSLTKSKERQNDFGGVLGGPILKNRTFFFFSYEGLRLRLPQIGITTVPSLRVRQSAPAAIQPFLNAYPLPNGPETLDSSGNPTGQAPFNAGFSDPSTLNATSIRIDHTVNNKINLFGRYNYAPSDLLTRAGGGSSASLSSLLSTSLKAQTVTLGATWTMTTAIADDLRFNYSRNRGMSSFKMDTFGGAVVPPDSLLFPPSFSSSDSFFQFLIFSLQGSGWQIGRNGNNLQRQFNLVDSLSAQKGSHALKFGIDYRHLSPIYGPAAYVQNAIFGTIPSVLAQRASTVIIRSERGSAILFNNLGAFAQDTWRVVPRLTITYGLRWDVDFAPSTGSGPSLLAVTGFDNPSTLALAPPGTPIFKTRYGNIAPRVGAAYELANGRGRETVLRGGFGVFYDLATQQIGDAVNGGFFPFGAVKFSSGTSFPLDPTSAQPPPISIASLASGTLVTFDPKLELPYALQWNIALEQSLGTQQSLTASYVGSVGRRLLQQQLGRGLTPVAAITTLVRNSSTSDYHASQLQFQRRLSHGLQALASYTWSHSIDTASTSSLTFSNTLIGDPRANRGPSDFDVRHSFSSGITYNIPTEWIRNSLARVVLRDWSVDSIVQARSATPVEVSTGGLLFLSGFGDVRPDLVPGVPLYLFDAKFPGGKSINNTVDQSRPGCKGPFCPPPSDPVTHLPLRQGILVRNALRGFGATQWDFAVRRQFSLHESLRLQFRAEFFNLLNHPNFGNPVGDLSKPSFGQPVQMLGRSLGNSLTGTGLNQLYQIGGPRSMQFALKVQF